MKRELKALHKRFGTWSSVAKALGVTERYVMAIRAGKRPGKAVGERIKQEVLNGI